MINLAVKTSGISESKADNILRIITENNDVRSVVQAETNTITVTKRDIIEMPEDMVSDDINEITDVEIKATIQSMVFESELSADEVTAILSLYPMWEIDKEYSKLNELYVYNGVLYKVLQTHTSQSTWTPDVAVSLFANVTPAGVIPLWVQPDSTNPFMKGDQVEFEGHIWESKIDTNTWSPKGYPGGWKDLGPK